jgi:hypothetical protein
MLTTNVPCVCCQVVAMSPCKLLFAERRVTINKHRSPGALNNVYCWLLVVLPGCRHLPLQAVGR